METLYLLPLTGVSLLFLSLVFIPMEKVFPAKPGQKVLRRGWVLDLCFFLGQYLLWSGIVLVALNYFADWIDGFIPPSFRQAVHGQPVWLQAVEVILLSDLLIYWGHRLQHKVEFLWRFHKVHHSAEHLDWLAAHREHPLDSVYTIGIINLPALVMGFDLSVLAAFVAFRGIWAIYIHSNVRLPLGPLKYIIGAPEMHHWHHDIERDRGNYANINPLMDIIFGTHTCPPHEPERFGIKEKFPKNYVGQLIVPLLPKKTAKAATNVRWRHWFSKKVFKAAERAVPVIVILTGIVACSSHKPLLRGGSDITHLYIYNHTYEDTIRTPSDSLKVYNTKSFEKSLELYASVDSMQKEAELMPVYFSIFKIDNEKFAIIADSTHTAFYKFSNGRYKRQHRVKQPYGMLVQNKREDINGDGYQDVLFSMGSGGFYGSDDYILFYNPKTKNLVYNKKPELRNAEIDNGLVRSVTRFTAKTYAISGFDLLLKEEEHHLQGDHYGKMVVMKYEGRREISRDTLAVPEQEW